MSEQDSELKNFTAVAAVELMGLKNFLIGEKKLTEYLFSGVCVKCGLDSYVEILTPLPLNVTVFGDRTFSKVTDTE